MSSAVARFETALAQAEDLIHARNVLRAPRESGNESFTNQEYFLTGRVSLSIKATDGKGIEIQCDCKDHCPEQCVSSSKIEFLVTPFERFTFFCL